MMSDHGIEVGGMPRSSRWPEVEKAHLAEEPLCVACGGHENLQVHHIIPFHFCILLGRPELELTDGNLITLCETPGRNHHLLIGHLDDWASANLNARVDATKTWYNQDEVAIQANAVWLAAKGLRLPMWADMTIVDKANLVALMAMRFPVGH